MIGANHYRCRFPSEYARMEGLDHPSTVYVREDRITHRLDAWLSQLFDPKNLTETVVLTAMVATGGVDEGAEARVEAAKRKLTDCDARLAKYRSAIDAGADPVVVAEWMRDTQGERLRAEKAIVAAQPTGALTEAQVRKLLRSLSDVAQVLEELTDEERAQAYAEFGVTITYNPGARLIIAEARPGACAAERVGGDSIQPNTRAPRCRGRGVVSCRGGDSRQFHVRGRSHRSVASSSLTWLYDAEPAHPPGRWISNGCKTA